MTTSLPSCRRSAIEASKAAGSMLAVPAPGDLRKEAFASAFCGAWWVIQLRDCWRLLMVIKDYPKECR
jgi:hypothetical protein